MKPHPCEYGCKRIAIETGRVKANSPSIASWCRCRRCNEYGPIAYGEYEAVTNWNELLIKEV